jgi:hypothetical protein
MTILPDHESRASLSVVRKIMTTETGWETEHGGDSHSEYVFYAHGYRFQLLPKNVYVNR